MNFFHKKKPVPDILETVHETDQASAAEAEESLIPDPLQASPCLYHRKYPRRAWWYRSQYQRAMKLALLWG